MTSQLLIRTDSKIKEAFKLKAKEQGVSMDRLLNTFIKDYIKRPEMVQTYVDEDMMDDIIRQSFARPEAKQAMKSLFDTIQSKGL